MSLHDMAESVREWVRNDPLHVYHLTLGGADFVKRGATEYVAHCPLHDDHHPSCRINLEKGTWYCDVCAVGGDVFDLFAAVHGLNSRSPTDFPHIVNELSKILDISDPSAATNGVPPRVKPATPLPPLTLEEFAEAKQLPMDFLRAHHLHPEGDHIAFEYRDEAGQRMPRKRLRFGTRYTPDGKLDRGLRWNNGKGNIGVYGLWLLPGWRRDRKAELFLVEGESDGLTALYHDLPCLALPGASTFGVLQASHITGFTRVFIVREPGQGGVTFEASGIARLAALNFAGEVLVIEMENLGVKDLSDLHLQHVDELGGFKLALELLRALVRPVTFAEDARTKEQAEGAASEKGSPDEAPEWPEPQPLPNGLPAVPAFNAALLPKGLHPWLTDIAERAQAPLDFLAAPAIVALSSAIGRRCGILPKRYDDWLVIPNLWGLIVGPPGFLKSPMLHEILKLLARLEASAREEYERDLNEFNLKKEAIEIERHKLKMEAQKAGSKMDRKGLIEKFRELDGDLHQPSRRRYMTNDPSVEKLGELLSQNPDGLLLTRDEIGGFLAAMDRRDHENDRSFYLQAWNGYSMYTYDRIVRGTIDVEGTCVAILGAITPGPLGAYLRETFSGEADDGLIQRMQLSLYPDPPSDWVNIDRPPNSAAREGVFKLFERLVGLGSTSQGSHGEKEPSQASADDAAKTPDGGATKILALHFAPLGAGILRWLARQAGKPHPNCRRTPDNAVPSGEIPQPDAVARPDFPPLRRGADGTGKRRRCQARGGLV
jgi:hypothetical protein